MWVASGAIDSFARGSIKPLISIFHQTIVMNLTNPRVAFFLAFLPQFVDPEIGQIQIQFALFGSIFMTSIFIVIGHIGLAGGQVRAFLGNS